MPASADQQYETTGEDVYRIGTAGTVSRVTYTGTQRLTVNRQGKQARFDAQARYVRDAEDGKSTLDARFVQVLLPGGTFQDEINEDPDFLTILNQPFAIQLDKPTMRDLSALKGAVPFSATSPLGGEAILRGFLRPGTPGEINGRPAIAVRFEAEGMMSGQLPDRSAASMAGRMRMDGTAYYSVENAMLLALDATLTIVAQLHDNDKAVPVRIVYRRFIRALAPGPAASAPPASTAPASSTSPPRVLLGGDA